MNKVILIGNLTRDPEVRYSPKGVAIAQIGFALNETRTDEQGNKKQKSMFIDLVAFGKRAETMAQYLRKGAKIAVEGKLDQQTWDDKQTGQKRTKIQIIVDNFDFCDSKQGQDRQRAAEAPQPDPVEDKPATTGDDEDLPF